MQTQTITLDYPVELVPHPKVTELTARRPKVKDELEAKRPGGSDADVEVRLFALLTGQPFEIIAELDLADYDKLQDALAGFRQRSGKTSSGAAPTTSENASFASPDRAST